MLASLNSADVPMLFDGPALPEEISNARASYPSTEQKRSEGRKWLGRLCLLLIFLLLAGIASRILPPASDGSVAHSQSLLLQSSMTAEQNIADLQEAGQASQDELKNRQQKSKEEVHEGQQSERYISEPSKTQNKQPQVKNTMETDYTESDTENNTETKFPRIVWVQTDFELDAKDMAEAMAAHNHIHFGKQDGFEVRIVNNLNAYDWLSKEMADFVTDIHLKSQIEVATYELLRLALLYEHGGIFLRPSIILMEGLGWVEKLMHEASSSQRKVLSCQRPGTQIIMFHEQWDDGRRYKDDFIAAKPKARLFRMILGITEEVYKKGAWPYPDVPNTITKVDRSTEVASFVGLTETLITIIHRKESNVCENYGVQSFDANKGVFMDAVNQPSATINLDQADFRDQRGRKYLLRFNMADIASDIIRAIKTQELSCSGSNSLLKNKIMMVEGNKWLTEPKKTTREVQLCIVSLAPMAAEDYEQKLQAQLDRLANQTFTNWTLVSFVKGLPSVYKNVSEQTVLVNASVYEGLNLQRAATKYCDPASVMLLLDYDETLGSENDLQTLAKHFEPIGVFAAFFKLKICDKVREHSAAVMGDVMRKVNKPNKEILSDVGNLMRAFLVETYRFIPAFEMYHSKSGRYFDRELPLLGVLELSERFTPCEDGTIVYQVRRFERLMAIPHEKVFTNITITTDRFKIANLSSYEYHAKFRQHEICDVILFCPKQNAPVEALVVLNNGREEGGLAARRGMPELIPRKIHQIWVKGEIPKFKRFLMQRARETHPDYEYFLWRKENFTRENFPQSYDLMQTMMEFDKRSRFNKMALVADVARNEIAYRHGGFYLDTNYMLYGDRPLDQFLTFSLVTAAEVSSQNRIFRDQAFFGTSQKSFRFARIVSRRVLASRFPFAENTARETGPGLFGKILYGAEELDEDILQPGFEEFYPNFIHDPPRLNYNKCIASDDAEDSEILFKSSKRRYLKNCSEIYYYAYGMDFLEEGGTWIQPRWW